MPKLNEVFFRDEPYLKLMRDGVRHMLMRPWIVNVDNKRYVIPEGFITDGASQHLFKRFSTAMTPAALFHDAAYRITEIPLTRRQADFGFLSIQMHVDRKSYPLKGTVSSIKRLACIARAYVSYAGVRALGWAFYKPRNV